MRKTLIFGSAVLWMVQLVLAQFAFGVAEEPQSKAIPSITIYPEDVMQDSIQQFRTATNRFTVRWQYTEEGAKKMRAFWDAQAGKDVRTRVGDFETPPALLLPRNPAQTNDIIAWEKIRTDKIFGVSEKEAEAIVAGLKKK